MAYQIMAGSKHTDDKREPGASQSPALPHPPLRGIRVLDLTRLLPGAFCTQLLADFGAEVIKIEQPGLGDYWRWTEPKVKLQSAQFLALNRGKRSITLDLKAAEAHEAFLRLCETADVVIEGFRPGVMDRLGLGYDVLKGRNPRLVVCALTGFGQEGPLAQVAAHDLNYVGMTGLLQLANGKTASPMATGLPIGDIGGGALMATAGILAALFDVSRGGIGRFVDVSVADGLHAWTGFMTARWNVPDLKEDTAPPFDAPFNKPFYSVYATSDGRHMVTGAYERKFWVTLCEVLELPEWLDRQWVSGSEEEDLRAAIAAAFARKSFAEWTRIFSEREACVTPVLTAREAMESDHARARGTVITVNDPVEGKLHHVGNPIRFDRNAFNSLTPAPALGEDNDGLLAEIGYSVDEIAMMRVNKTI